MVKTNRSEHDLQDTLYLLADSLHLNYEDVKSWNVDTRLFGAISQLDSMSVLGILAELEKRYGITLEQQDLPVGVFDTVGKLHAFIVTLGG